MESYGVKLGGEGRLDTVTCEVKRTPLFDAPILRGIKMSRKQTTFISEGEEFGGLNLDENEYPVAAVQDGQRIFLVSEIYGPGHNNFATVHYVVREAQSGNGVLTVKPKSLYTIRYETNQRESVADLLFDGESNRPTIALHLPTGKHGQGYGSFVVEYSPVIAFALDSSSKKVLSQQVLNLELRKNKGRNLLRMTIPASNAAELVKEGSAKSLEALFRQADLERVNEISRSIKSNELIEPTHYPKYAIEVDTKGKIYFAERIEAQH